MSSNRITPNLLFKKKQEERERHLKNIAALVERGNAQTMHYAGGRFILNYCHGRIEFDETEDFLDELREYVPFIMMSESLFYSYSYNLFPIRESTLIIFENDLLECEFRKVQYPPCKSGLIISEKYSVAAPADVFESQIRLNGFSDEVRDAILLKIRI